MATERFYYHDTIAGFAKTRVDTIIGKLTRAAYYDINKETSNSWIEEIEILQDVLEKYKERGSVFIEYIIPRIGHRVDVIALIDGIVFVMEFKTSEQNFTNEASTQVWDYALDLKNFHLGSRHRAIIPVLIAPNGNPEQCKIVLKPSEDNVYEPLHTNRNKLKECLETILKQVAKNGNYSPTTDHDWAISGYDPTPTIVEAAVALFEKHTVEEITRHDGEIGETSKTLSGIIAYCRENKRKAICFVTGVPGAGKTLIGLQTAIEQFNQGEKAVYLSGNLPLVKVLQEALTRDYVRRSKEEYKTGVTEKKPCTKKEATSKVKAFIQIIHHYRDLYLEGTEIREGKIIAKEGYFNSHKDKAYIPTEHVAIFDEAQRAWTKDELANFMKKKKHIEDFPYSEPEYLISCMDRHDDWGLVICLIGGGQEINRGEAGLIAWIDALNHHYRHWDIYISDRLTEQEYAGGKAIELINQDNRLHIKPALHLSVSMRSFRAEKVSLFVHQLLELNTKEAITTLKGLENYPIVLTRSLDKARSWLRGQARGSERYGMLACSKADRLKAISINVRYQPDFVHWFLENDKDVRSSNALEDALTEFEVQGLEIDWACVAWDADLRLNTRGNGWQHYQLRGGTSWQQIRQSTNKEYHINAYRVLLTRARQGMVILVPDGDTSHPQDETRKPEWYDGIYNYLKGIGLKEI